jgi:hypothetical protein
MKNNENAAIPASAISMLPGRHSRPSGNDAHASRNRLNNSSRSVSGIDQIDSLLRKELFDEWAWTLGFRSWERVFAPTI